MLPETERLEIEEHLKEEILAVGTVPRHVAVIMDGNRRWARRRRRPGVFGHLAGRHAVRQTITAAHDLGVEVLTLYTFSVENWHRPATEVSALMRILQQTTVLRNCASTGGSHRRSTSTLLPSAAMSPPRAWPGTAP